MDVYDAQKPVGPSRLRRYLRFRLHTIGIAIAIFAVAFGWIGRRAHSLRDRYEAIKYFHSRGFKTVLVPVDNEWFWRPIVGDAAVNLHFIRLCGGDFELQNSDVQLLRKFPELTRLVSEGSAFDDVACELLSENCRQLVTLNLGPTAITDGGVEKIGRISSLESIEISRDIHRRVTPASLVSCLTSLQRLTDITIVEIRIGDQGLAAICNCNKELTGLRLFDTGITDSGIIAVGGLNKLRGLTVRGDNHITDAMIESLRPLKNLKTLELGNTNVSGKAVDGIRCDLPSLSMSTERILRDLN